MVGSVGDESISGTIRLESEAALRVSLVVAPLIVGFDPTSPPESCGNVDACIGVHDITVEPGSMDLAPGIPTDIKITVAGVPAPDIYEGAWTLLSRAVVEEPGNPDEPTPTPEPLQSSAVTVQVEVEPSPDVAVLGGTETVVATRVQTTLPGEELLASIFLSPGERLTDLLVPVTNSTDELVSVTGSATAIGEHTAAALPDGALLPPDPATAIEARSAAVMDWGVRAETVLPDTYVGALLLDAGEGEARVEVPLQLSIRPGPLVPLLLIIAGVVLGWLAKFLMERGSRLADVYSSYRQSVKRLAEADLELGDRDHLAGRLATIEQTLRALKDAPAKDDLMEWGIATAVLVSLTEFEAATGQTYAADIAGIRVRARDGQASKARDELVDLRVRAAKDSVQLRPFDQPEMVGREPPVEVIERPRSQRAARWVVMVGLSTAAVFLVIGFVISLSSYNTAPPDFGWLVNAAIAVAVVGAAWWAGAELVKRHLLDLVVGARPVLYLILFVGLAFVGMELLYVNGLTALIGARSDAFLQYVVWGLGTDVASRTISNFAQV
ncbi:MAG: hypothetical protein M3406_05080 [Chloroflexota bacterium]|nr:hypothetical protein [Chloroflexota bacterium]